MVGEAADFIIEGRDQYGNRSVFGTVLPTRKVGSSVCSRSVVATVLPALKGRISVFQVNGCCVPACNEGRNQCEFRSVLGTVLPAMKGGISVGSS